ncbi:hypothetical protein CYY_007479 [Polysphondylium violaceum]|uniref:Nuclear pore complex protein Nup85 n=1 Tax=Polysphondylium violaceum TaxID=133409 RepID=A0A8J4PP74_9MYCE|nr:hypothetical protein CYY_007479 [Polysphondylium violaceum]
MFSTQSNSNNNKFVDFCWAPNGDMLLYDSIPETGKEKTSPFGSNNQKQQDDQVQYERKQILSETRKFYNEIFIQFKSMQIITSNNNNNIVPDERVREIIAMSKNYQSIMLATRDQMELSWNTGSFLDNEDCYINSNPFDKDSIEQQTERISKFMSENKDKDFIIFCGSIDSIYPYLCSKLSKETGMKCILIARESTPPSPKRNEVQNYIENNGNELVILSKQQYSDRYSFINQQYGDREGLSSFECDESIAKIQAEVDNFRVLSMVWKVAHLFYFNTSVMSPTHLLDCLQFERQELLGQMSNYIDVNSSSNSNHVNFDKSFYTYMANLLVNGCIEEVIHLLNILSRAPRHSSSIRTSTRRSPINIIIDLLQKIPLKKKTIYPNETLILWNKWHSEIQNVLSIYTQGTSSSSSSTSTLSGSIDDNLIEIIRILLGDQSTISKYCTSFLQLVVSNILYCEYTTSISQLRQLFIQCYNKYQSRSAIEKMLISFATKDLELTLKKALKHFPIWFVVHLSDLLYHHPYVMKKNYNEESQLSPIRQFLLSEYGQYLSSNGMIELGINYLENVKVGGKEMIDEIILRQPIHYEKDALRLISKASNQETKKSIYRMLSMNDFKRKRYASSLSWLMHSNDAPRVALLVNQLLEPEYLDSTLLQDLQSLMEKKESIPNFEISSELVFLVKYRELLNLWKDRNFKEYSVTLCNMFRDNLVPKRFWIRLMIDTIPLLESMKYCYFNYQDTTLLISCLEEIRLSHLFDNYSKGTSDQDIESLRLALSRNLSKSIMSTTLINNNNQITPIFGK